MKNNLLKYLISGIVILLLLKANLNLLGEMFADHPDENDHLKLKENIILNENEMVDMISSFYLNTPIALEQDMLERNKYHIKSTKNSVGYVYTLDYEIPCSACSNVNYLVLVDSKYSISKLIPLRDLIENHKPVDMKKFENYLEIFVGKNLVNNDFTEIRVIPNPEKHSYYLKKSFEKLSTQARLFYEK